MQEQSYEMSLPGRESGSKQHFDVALSSHLWFPIRTCHQPKPPGTQNAQEPGTKQERQRTGLEGEVEHDQQTVLGRISNSASSLKTKQQQQQTNRSLINTHRAERNCGLADFGISECNEISSTAAMILVSLRAHSRIPTQGRKDGR